MKRYLLLAGGWIACALGCIGVILPVLPTTPFLLLATFLFAKSSPRLHAWIKQTKVYRVYVISFQEAGGLPIKTKARMLLISYAVLGVSAYFAPLWFVWVILAAVAVFLLYLVIVRIPTIPQEEFLLRQQKQQQELD